MTFPVRCVTSKARISGVCGFTNQQLMRENFDSFNSPLFRKAKVLTDDVVVLVLAKDKVIWDLPFQVGFMVYGNAKLRMLQFYYDFLMKYFHSSDLQLLGTDTDSL